MNMPLVMPTVICVKTNTKHIIIGSRSADAHTKVQDKKYIHANHNDSLIRPSFELNSVHTSQLYQKFSNIAGLCLFLPGFDVLQIGFGIIYKWVMSGLKMRFFAHNKQIFAKFDREDIVVNVLAKYRQVRVAHVVTH